MNLFWSGFTALLSLLLGNFTLQYMTVHPLKLARTGFRTGAVFTLQLINLVVSKENIFSNIGVALVSFVASYLFSTLRFLEKEEDMMMPELTREEGEKGDGHTAVVYFTHGEPETYNPIGWINQINEFDVDAEEIIMVPPTARG